MQQRVKQEAGLRRGKEQPTEQWVPEGRRTGRGEEWEARPAFPPQPLPLQPSPETHEQNLKAAGDSKVRGGSGPEATAGEPGMTGPTPSHPPPSLTLYIPVPCLPLPQPRKQRSATKSVKRKRKKTCITPSKR